ncbi:hypothetical protein [Pseudanabaena sp. 'Roaring Creek']|uniref:hypothetical protein n=1 Tax=Pseudanabaena sp. 'Roaring Creek' TaxID=1681830 RepID=UPI0006D7FD46|nr:hypothetical protein [Pseudanabaena sp. 'Roaring Creek']
MAPNKPKRKLNFLDFASTVILLYLALKFVAVPIVQTAVNFTHRDRGVGDIAKVPDFTFPDITLIAIILLFQPQTSDIFKSIDFSSGGLKAEFKDLRSEMLQTKEDLDKRQQEQIDRMNKLQNFMYCLILTPKEIEKLKGIKDNSMHEFYVSKDAASELRRLRDSNLIAIVPPFQYISDLEKASNYGSIAIDLVKYCELTQSGQQFLQNLEEITRQKHQNNQND